MKISRMRTIAVAALVPALLGGCLMDDGYYGGLSVGAGDYYGGDYYGRDYYGRNPYGYDPYGGYYGGHGYGWYDNYYYPGRGAYIYDRSGRRHAMRERDRAHWLDRREARTERREGRLERRRDRFEGRDDRFERRHDRSGRRDDRFERRQDRFERRAGRPDLDPAVIERRQARREGRRSQGVFNNEARQSIRQAVRNARERGETTPQQP